MPLLLNKFWYGLLLLIAGPALLLIISNDAAAGSLIKASGPAVYYLSDDGKRYVFPNAATYFTWYDDFSGVATVSDAQLASYTIGGNVTYRPGVRLVKITSDPKVYAVDRLGTLRGIASEAVASALYGSDWNTKVDDIPDAFFVNYQQGAEIASVGDFNPVSVRQAASTFDVDRGVASNADTSLGSAYLGSYTIDDTGFGTEVTVTVDNQTKTRTIMSNALPNHATGEFPNSGNPNTISEQDRTWTFPTEPVFTGTATSAREPGVAINGVKFEPDTAERATCDSGEVHSIEAIQDVTDLGLDFNNAHVQPTGEYHYHGVSDLLVNLYSSGQDLVHVAFAADGHLIYYSKSGAYAPSYRTGTDARDGTNCTYTSGGPNGRTISFGPERDGSLKSDWEYNESYGQLDECNGVTVDGQYIYLITDEYPFVPRCLMGSFTESAPGGAGPGGQGPPPGGGFPPPPPF